MISNGGRGVESREDKRELKNKERAPLLPRDGKCYELRGIIILFFNKFIYFIYLFLAALGLCCCVRGATLHCGERASHCSGFSCFGAWALGVWASVVVAHGL